MDSTLQPLVDPETGGLKSASQSILAKFITVLKSIKLHDTTSQERVLDILQKTSYLILKTLTEKYSDDFLMKLKKWTKEAHTKAVKESEQDSQKEGFLLSLLKLLRKLPVSYEMLKTTRIGSVVGKMSSQVSGEKVNEINNSDIIQIADALVEKWKRVGKEAQKAAASTAAVATQSSTAADPKVKKPKHAEKGNRRERKRGAEEDIKSDSSKKQRTTDEYGSTSKDKHQSSNAASKVEKKNSVSNEAEDILTKAATEDEKNEIEVFGRVVDEDELGDTSEPPPILGFGELGGVDIDEAADITDGSELSVEELQSDSVNRGFLGANSDGEVVKGIGDPAKYGTVQGGILRNRFAKKTEENDEATKGQRKKGVMWLSSALKKQGKDSKEQGSTKGDDVGNRYRSNKFVTIKVFESDQPPTAITGKDEETDQQEDTRHDTQMSKARLSEAKLEKDENIKGLLKTNVKAPGAGDSPDIVVPKVEQNFYCLESAFLSLDRKTEESNRQNKRQQTEFRVRYKSEVEAPRIPSVAKHAWAGYDPGAVAAKVIPLYTEEKPPERPDEVTEAKKSTRKRLSSTKVEPTSHGATVSSQQSIPPSVPSSSTASSTNVDVDNFLNNFSGAVQQSKRSDSYLKRVSPLGETQPVSGTYPSYISQVTSSGYVQHSAPSSMPMNPSSSGGMIPMYNHQQPQPYPYGNPIHQQYPHAGGPSSYPSQRTPAVSGGMAQPYGQHRPHWNPHMHPSMQPHQGHPSGSPYFGGYSYPPPGSGYPQQQYTMQYAGQGYPPRSMQQTASAGIPTSNGGYPVQMPYPQQPGQPPPRAGSGIPGGGIPYGSLPRR